MEIIKSSGCTAFYTLIDNKEIGDYTIQELDEILYKIIEHLKKENHPNAIIDELVQMYGIWEFEDEPCDQCGDTVSRAILTID